MKLLDSHLGQTECTRSDMILFTIYCIALAVASYLGAT
jgi:hypothetical protein